MAVIFAVVGGAVVGIATSDPYSDYSDYDNYSNYSDAAERRRRRMEEKKREIDDQKYEINTYKTNSVNGYLQSSFLKQQSGVSVSMMKVKDDADNKISNEEREKVKEESSSQVEELEQINRVIEKIDKVLREEK